MELLKIFPLSQKVVGGKTASLVKTAAIYFTVLVGGALACIILSIVPLLKIVGSILNVLIPLYVSMGLVVTVLLFVIRSNENKGENNE